MYQELGLDRSRDEQMPPRYNGTRWDRIQQTWAAYRLTNPGSEWWLRREWFERSPMSDRLGCEFFSSNSSRLNTT